MSATSILRPWLMWLMPAMQPSSPVVRYRQLVIAPQGWWRLLVLGPHMVIVVAAMAAGATLWVSLSPTVGCCDPAWVHAQVQQADIHLTVRHVRQPAAKQVVPDELQYFSMPHAPSLLLATGQPEDASAVEPPAAIPAPVPVLRPPDADPRIRPPPGWRLSVQRPMMPEYIMQQLVARAYAYLQSAQPEMAISLLEDVLRADPHHMIALEALAAIARQQGRVDEALAYQQRMQWLVPDAALPSSDVTVGGE